MSENEKTVIVRTDHDMKPPGEACLVSVQGNQLCRRYRLEGERVLIGRSDDCQIRTDEQGVSRQHAKVQVVGNAIEVVDLGSRAGVLVRGQRVPRALVSAGESFTVCGTRITLVEAAPSGGREPSKLAPPPGVKAKRPSTSTVDA